MSDVSKLVSHLQHNGVMRANRFRVTIPLPADIRDLTSETPTDLDDTQRFISNGIRIYKAATGGGVEASRSLQVLCSTIQIPGININTAQSSGRGHKVEIASGADKSDLRVGFLLSRDMAEKKTLDNWQSLIYDERTSKLGYYDDYTVDIQVEILDEFDRVVYSFVAQDAYPNLFNGLEYDRAESGSFLYYRLGFTYGKIVYGDQAVEAVNPLRNFRPAQIVEEVQNGNVAGAIAKSRDLIVRAKEGSISSEMGKDLHKIVSDIVNSPSGFSDVAESVVGGISSATDALGIASPDSVKSALASMQIDIQNIDALPQSDKSSLLDMLRELLNV